MTELLISVLHVEADPDPPASFSLLTLSRSRISTLPENMEGKPTSFL